MKNISRHFFIAAIISVIATAVAALGWCLGNNAAMATLSLMCAAVFAVCMFTAALPKFEQ